MSLLLWPCAGRGGRVMGDRWPEARVRELLLEKLKFRVATPISRELLEPDMIDIAADIIYDAWTVMADWRIPGKQSTREIGWVSVPDGWWQAFKAEALPRWLRRPFPARMRTYPTSLQVIKVCPELRSELGPW